MELRKTSSEKDIEKAYSRLSYVYGGFENFFEGKLRNRSLDLFNVKSGDKVLEIGFGTGYNLVELAKIAGDKGMVYGVDLTQEMINISKKRLDKNNLEKRAKLTKGNAKKLPFKNNLFDKVYISNVLEILSEKDIKRVLNEIKRVLKPKGKICVIDVAKKGYEKSLFMKFYLFLNKNFPSYTSSPIDAEIYLKKSKFKIIKKEIVKIFGFFPMQVVIGRI
ncbi:class I SAM-dependent methyltransferase [Candidatus Pacearchaeota archaeon]|nr:class I SAM-dependent methyltransferase [Candidatus Pacearchaeota archaeon]